MARILYTYAMISDGISEPIDEYMSYASYVSVSIRHPFSTGRQS